MPPHPTFYVRSTIYKQFGIFDISYKIAADYDCMLRFLGRGEICCRYIPEILVKMRIGGVSNRSLKNILRKSVEDYRVLHSNNVGGVWSLFLKNFLKIRQFFVLPRSWATTVGMHSDSKNPLQWKSLSLLPSFCGSHSRNRLLFPLSSVVALKFKCSQRTVNKSNEKKFPYLVPVQKWPLSPNSSLL